MTDEVEDARDGKKLRVELDQLECGHVRRAQGQLVERHAEREAVPEEGQKHDRLHEIGQLGRDISLVINREGTHRPSCSKEISPERFDEIS